MQRVDGEKDGFEESVYHKVGQSPTRGTHVLQIFFRQIFDNVLQ